MSSGSESAVSSHDPRTVFNAWHRTLPDRAAGCPGAEARGEWNLLGLIVAPVLVGGGMQLTPSVGVDADLTLDTERRLQTGAVEIIYAGA